MSQENNKMIDTADFEHYEQALESFLAGELDANDFLHTRLHLGVYNQRQDGMCMIRTKLPGGKMSAKQMLGFANCIEKFSIMDDAQITTRQDIQFHYVPLRNTPDLQRELGQYDIATREAAGNTVRNITACHLSGVCPAEHVDVQAYLDQVAKFFVRHPLTQSLPRKFKISFSGCAHDCAQGLIHDLAVIATVKDGNKGFKLLVGGGLGAKPKLAVELLDFVTENELIPAIEAVLILHDRFSDRKKRTRNRIKFLVERFGEEKFKADFLKEFTRNKVAYNHEKTANAVWRKAEVTATALGENLSKPTEQRQKGFFALPIFVRNGDLSIKQFRGLAQLLEDENLDDLRTNQEQNLTLFNVPQEKVAFISEKIADLGLKVADKWQGVVSCPGTSTCPLGITNSDRVGQIIQSRGNPLNVRINGCQNSCANSSIADVGFYGKGIRHFGTLIPSYKLQLAGNGRDGGQIAFDGPQVPAARVFKALDIITASYNKDKHTTESFFTWARRKGEEYFKDLLHPLTLVRETELPFLVRDLGEREAFQVLSVGVGECAGAQINPIEKLYMEAQYEAGIALSFATKYKYDDAVESLLKRLFILSKIIFFKLAIACDADDFVGQLELLKQHGFSKIDPSSSFSKSLEVLYADIEKFQFEPDEQTFPSLAKQVDQWEVVVRELEQIKQEKQANQH